MHARRMGEAITDWDIRRNSDDAVHNFYRASPGGVPTQVAFSQDARFDSRTSTETQGCIREGDHAFSKDGGLAVLYRQHRAETGSS